MKEMLGHRHPSYLLVLPTLYVLLFSGYVAAAAVTFSYVGTDGDGATVSGTFGYDTDAPDINGNAFAGLYLAGFINGVITGGAADGFSFNLDMNGAQTEGHIRTVVTANEFFSGLWINEVSAGGVGEFSRLSLDSISTPVFDDSSLPTELNVADWMRRTLDIRSLAPNANLFELTDINKAPPTLASKVPVSIFVLLGEDREVTSVTVDPDRVVLFEADRRSVTATTRAADGAVLTGRKVTWSTRNSAVATVSTTGDITAVSVGTATIRATVEGQQGDTLVTVTPPISTYEDYKVHFPYQVTNGQFVVSSDFSAAFSQQHLEHLMKTWLYFSTVYAGSAGTYTEMYYTRDLAGLYARIIATCPTTIVVGGRNLTACFDYQNGVYIWFVVPYIEPDFGTQLHEIGHSFLYFTQFDSANWPWFNEGISMYWESGSFDANGSYSVTTPLPYLTSNFRRASNANALVPLPTLFQLTRNQFYGDPDPAKLYSQAGMLLYYLFQQYPAVAQAVIESINNGQIANNNAVINYILQQTGLTIAELDANYTQYALQF